MTSVIRNPAVKTYTYAPGKAPAGQQGQEIKLTPGQTLGFRTGAGYYAKPAAADPYSPPARSTPPAAPAPPPSPYAALPAATIDKQAGAQAQAQLTPQQDEIRRQQTLAHQQAQADAEKIKGLSTADAALMAQLGPEAQAAYERAAATEGSLGQGLATGAATDVAARVAADKSFMESQGQTGGPGPDTAALHDSIYALNGQIPGDTFAEQGAAAAKWGLAQAPIALNAGREQLDQRMATAAKENDQYAQQLIQLAGQYPDLKAAALKQLNQYELDKATYRLNVIHTNRSDALAARSEKAQEEAAGITGDYKKAEMKYKWASLAFQTEKARAAAQAASAKGKTIDVSASKLLGHIVYKDGTQDPSIKVKQSTTGGITAAAKVKARLTANKSAFDYATKLLGTPVKAPKGSKGAYVAGTKGVPNSATFPPAYPGGPRTTNNPKYANHASGATDYADAQKKVYAEISGDVLISDYGYTREQVMTIVNQALARAGWKRK